MKILVLRLGVARARMQVRPVVVALPNLDSRLPNCFPVTVDHAAEDVRDDAVSLLLVTRDAHEIVDRVQAVEVVK